MGKFISQIDVENRWSPSSVAYVFTDPGSSSINADALAACIDDAEAEVESWLLGDIAVDSPAFNRADRMIRRCAFDFFCVFAYRRRPEYEKTFGDAPRGQSLWEDAQARMQRVQASLQRLPDQPNLTPGNLGGIITDDGPRQCITSADGRRNGDGF
jgi:hypothetical protein